MTQKVGFIGLGIMGKPMALNLVKAGFGVTVYGHYGDVLEELRGAGASVAGSEAEAAAASDVSITMVQNGPQAKAAIIGGSGALGGAKPGHLVIDMSSIAPAVSQEIGAACEAKGVGFLDAPVSGGEPGAIAGQLAIMVGGRADHFEAAKPIFDVLGKSAVLCGECGAGNTTKLSNQIVVAANIYAVAEALVLAAKAGVDPEKVYNAIKGGLAGSNVMNAKAPMMLARNFQPGFRVELHLKDIDNASETAKRLGLPLELTAKLQAILQDLVRRGDGALDHSAILKHLERETGTTING